MKSRRVDRSDTGRVVVWCRSLFCGWMLATGTVLAIGLLTIALINPEYRTLCLWLLTVAAAFLVTGAIRVTVDQRGVMVASALLPLLRRGFPLRRIKQATARWTRATEVGGWGYRWNPGLSAISLRGGDALWLSLTNGTQFVITIDDAESAAALLNSYLPQKSGSQ